MQMNVSPVKLVKYPKGHRRRKCQLQINLLDFLLLAGFLQRRHCHFSPLKKLTRILEVLDPVYFKRAELPALQTEALQIPGPVLKLQLHRLRLPPAFSPIGAVISKRDDPAFQNSRFQEPELVPSGFSTVPLREIDIDPAHFFLAEQITQLGQHLAGLHGIGRLQALQSKQNLILLRFG
ncbi:hypothetical protein D3C78_595240 [compost metagenome]